MFRFFIGLALGLATGGLSLFGVLAGYNPPVTPEWEAASTALAILIAVLLVAAAVTAVIGLMGMFLWHEKKLLDQSRVTGESPIHA